MTKHRPDRAEIRRRQALARRQINLTQWQDNDSRVIATIRDGWLLLDPKTQQAMRAQAIAAAESDIKNLQAKLQRRPPPILTLD